MHKNNIGRKLNLNSYQQSEDQKEKAKAKVKDMCDWNKCLGFDE